MKYNITKIPALRAATVTALCYTVAIMIIIPFILLIGLASETPGRETAVILVTMFVYPIVSFLAALIGTLIYNLVAHITGGVQIELAAPAKPVAASTSDLLTGQPV
jgi:hypothetical protein